MSASVEQQMEEILREYGEKTERAVDAAAKRAAQRTAATLRATSPKEPSGGEYARGWGYKSEKGFGGSVATVVHNKTKPGLTHLLEKGHVTKNQYGTYRRTPAHKHIEPAEQKGDAIFLAEVMRKV